MAVAVQNDPIDQYVQDGLVHLWDGINNTGEGHDSEATVWADLIGDYPINKTNPGSTWLSNALYFNPQTKSDLQAWTGTGSIKNTTMTIEMVIEPGTNEAFPTGRAACVGSFVGYGKTAHRRFGTSPGDTSVGVFCNESTKGFCTTGFEGCLGVRSIVGTYTTTSKADSIYVNGVKKTKNATHTYSDDKTRDYVILGGYDYAGTATYPYLGKIYSVRIYNRVLTADEIAQNYAVDVARFGLSG